MKEIASIALALVGMIAVLAFTYFASRWYAGRVGAIAGGRHLKVIDRLVVGKSASLLIVELQGSFYLVGVSEQGVTILKELDEPISAPEADRRLGFPDMKLRGTDFRELMLGRFKRKGNGL